MALRAGPPRAPGTGGGGGPCGEGARPHCSVGAAGEPGQCRVAGGGGRGRRAQAKGWWSMPAAVLAGGRRLLTPGAWGQRLTSGSFTRLQKPWGARQTFRPHLSSLAPVLLTELRPQKHLGKSLPCIPIREQTGRPSWRRRSSLLPNHSACQRAGKQGQPALHSKTPEGL